MFKTIKQIVLNVPIIIIEKYCVPRLHTNTFTISKYIIQNMFLI